MLKITELSPDILQVSMGYMKGFLAVMGVLALVFLIFLVMSYKQISLEADRSQDFCKVQVFGFFTGFQTQELKLSDIQEMKTNLSKGKSSRYVTTYEKPSLLLKNGEQFFLFKSSRSVFYASKFSEKFNQFLKHSQENTFQKKTIYMGVLSTIIIGILGAIIIIMAFVTILVGDVKMTFNKQANTYQIKYFSPMYPNKEGKLTDIQNLRIISEVQTSFSAKQAGLYLELANEELILIQALGGPYKPEQVPKYLAPIQANGEKIAVFLGLEIR